MLKAAAKILAIRLIELGDVDWGLHHQDADIRRHIVNVKNFKPTEKQVDVILKDADLGVRRILVKRADVKFTQKQIEKILTDDSEIQSVMIWRGDFKPTAEQVMKGVQSGPPADSLWLGKKRNIGVLSKEQINALIASKTIGEDALSALVQSVGKTLTPTQVEHLLGYEKEVMCSSYRVTSALVESGVKIEARLVDRAIKKGAKDGTLALLVARHDIPLTEEHFCLLLRRDEYSITERCLERQDVVMSREELSRGLLGPLASTYKKHEEKLEAIILKRELKEKLQSAKLPRATAKTSKPL
jgi:hypothetical protein